MYETFWVIGQVRVLVNENKGGILREKKCLGSPKICFLCGSSKQKVKNVQFFFKKIKTFLCNKDVCMGLN